MPTIALYNLKGGVGKTAGCINLAYLAAADGHKVLVWDLDPQGAATFYLKGNANPKNSTQKLLTQDVPLAETIAPTEFQLIDLVAADMSGRKADVILSEAKGGKKRLKQILTTIKGKYDFIFIDCPPGLSLLHEAVFNAADVVLVPCIPTTLSERTYVQVKEYFRENEITDAKLLAYFSMVDLRKTLHNETLEQHYRQKDFLKNYIPYLSDVEKMGLHKSPIMEFANSGYAAKCFRDVWKELQSKI